MQQIKLYNTLSKKKEKFKPLNPPKVTMYHCGPTVYWTQHIGNMRAMVLADLVVRSLKYLDYQIILTRNYTDVGHLTSDSDEGEDKMEKSAKKEKSTPQEIAQKYINIFERDIFALNVNEADFKPRATECIQDMVAMVRSLLNKGYAYTTQLAVYFDVSKAKNYNQLSRQKLEEQIKGAGKAEVNDPQKKNPADFALWFFKAGKHQNALQTWNSPFTSPLVKNGEGFPGWHIECSVMASKFMGKTIDIHMGGVEHIPVHHTNEIAQSEAANEVKFVNYWLHNEHLLFDKEKMSKSTGSLYSLQEIIDKGYNPLALRYFFMQAHYRSKQNFTFEALDAAQNGLDKLYQLFSHELALLKETKIDGKTQQEFKNRLADDFNLPQALSIAIQTAKADMDNGVKKATLLDFDKVLGLNLNHIKPISQAIPDEVNQLAKERLKSRQNKDFVKADELRKKIEQKGYEIEDNAGEYKIKKI